MKYLLIIGLLYYYSSVIAQEVLQSRDPKFSILLDIGNSYSLQKFTSTPTNESVLYYENQLGLSSGLGIQIFHKNNWFTTYHYYRYDLVGRVNLVGNRSTDIDGFDAISFSGTSFTYNNFSLRLGKSYLLKNSSWMHGGFAGLNLEFVKDKTNIPIGFSGLDRELLPLMKEEEGIHPAIQGGYQITYSDEILRISLLVLGNIGFKYHSSETRYARLKQDEYINITQNKGDAVSLLLQIGFDFGNKNK